MTKLIAKVEIQFDNMLCLDANEKGGCPMNLYFSDGMRGEGNYCVLFNKKLKVGVYADIPFAYLRCRQCKKLGKE